MLRGGDRAVLGGLSGQGDLNGRTVEMVVDFPRVAMFKVKAQNAV